MKILIYTITKWGHRELYINSFKNLYPSDILVEKPSLNSLYKIFSYKGPVIFITIDDSFLFFQLASLMRFLMRKKTLGITLDVVNEAHFYSFKEKFKFLLKSLVKKLKISKIFSIVPFEVNKKNERISDDWIYDPAFWDLHVKLTKYTPLNLYEIDPIFEKNFNKNTLTVLYLGSLDNRKGFHEFVELALLCKEKLVNMNFVAAGPTGLALCESDLINFSSCDGFLVNRVLSEREVFTLQNSSDVHWACYPISFNQSSGIVGRAFQLQKIVITRKESIAARIMLMLNASHIATVFGDHDYVLNSITKELDIGITLIKNNDVDACFNLSYGKINKYII